MTKGTFFKIWQKFLIIVFVFVIVHFAKDITQDILRVSTPLDIIGDVKEDLSFLPSSLQNIYLYGLGGLSFLAELVLIFTIPKVWKEEKLSKMGKIVIFLVLFLLIFFVTAILLDPRYNILMETNFIQVLTLIFSAISSIFVIYLKFYFDKKLKKDDYKLDDLRELNKKLNDRLVEAEIDIKRQKEPSETIKKRLLFAGFRLDKYDNLLLSNIYKFIHLWELSVDQLQRKLINDGEYSKEKTRLLELIKIIRINADTLVK